MSNEKKTEAESKPAPTKPYFDAQIARLQRDMMQRKQEFELARHELSKTEGALALAVNQRDLFFPPPPAVPDKP